MASLQGTNTRRWDLTAAESRQSEADRFLAALGKNGSTRVRAFFHSENPKKATDTGAKGSWNQKRIEAWQAEGRGIYCVIGNGGDCDAEITDIPAVFWEWDDRPIEEQLAFDFSHFLQPSMRVLTGNKSVHNYIVFDKPTDDIARWKALMQRIIAAFKSDSKIKNPSRVMRVPGFYYADGEGALVKQVTIHDLNNNRYSIDEVEEGLARYEKHIGIQPDRRSSLHIPTTRGTAWLSEAARERIKIDNARPRAQVEAALKLMPEYVPGNGTYGGDNPVKNAQGDLVHIDFFQTAVGCMKAFVYAGVDEEEAFELIQAQHPKWANLRQNLQGSGGVGANGRPIEDSSFWKTAIEKFGWKPDTVDEDAVVGCTESLRAQIQQNRITAEENFELMGVLPRNLALPLAERADTFPVHQSAMFAPVCTAVATALGRRVKVRIKVGHEEPLVFWMANVQAMSSMKSPVGKEIALEPLNRLNALDKKRYAEQREEIEAWFALAARDGIPLTKAMRMKHEQPEEWEKVQKHLGSHRFTTKVQRNVEAYLKNPINGIDPPRCAVTKDVTIERLAELLSKKNNHGLLLYFDELAQFMESMDQYRLAGGDRQRYLDMWSGSIIDVQRKGDGHTHAASSNLSLFGYIQPDKLREMFGKEDLSVQTGGDGFWARWLFCTPPHIPSEYNLLEAHIGDLMNELLQRLDQKIGTGTVLVADEESKRLYLQTYNRWLKDAATESLMLQGFIGKLKGYLARFAGLFHCIDFGMGDEEHMSGSINVETMQRAVNVCEYFLRQFQMVMANAGTTGIPAWVNQLEIKVTSNSLEQVTTTNITRWRIADSAKDANDKIVQLVDELGIGDKKQNRQKNWVWFPKAPNPHREPLEDGLRASESSKRD